MLYMGDRLGYWEGKAQGPDNSAEIEIFVDGTLHDPLEVQHKFYKDLCIDWQRLLQEMLPLIEERWRTRHPTEKSTSLSQEIRIVSGASQMSRVTALSGMFRSQLQLMITSSRCA